MIKINRTLPISFYPSYSSFLCFSLYLVGWLRHPKLLPIRPGIRAICDRNVYDRIISPICSSEECEDIAWSNDRHVQGNGICRILQYWACNAHFPTDTVRSNISGQQPSQNIICEGIFQTSIIKQSEYHFLSLKRIISLFLLFLYFIIAYYISFFYWYVTQRKQSTSSYDCTLPSFHTQKIKLENYKDESRIKLE